MKVGIMRELDEILKKLDEPKQHNEQPQQQQQQQQERQNFKIQDFAFTEVHTHWALWHDASAAKSGGEEVNTSHISPMDFTTYNWVFGKGHRNAAGHGVPQIGEVRRHREQPRTFLHEQKKKHQKAE
jgi:hypothetical protein